MCRMRRLSRGAQPGCGCTRSAMLFEARSSWKSRRVGIVTGWYCDGRMLWRAVVGGLLYLRRVMFDISNLDGGLVGLTQICALRCRGKGWACRPTLDRQSYSLL